MIIYGNSRSSKHFSQHEHKHTKSHQKTYSQPATKYSTRGIQAPRYSTVAITPTVEDAWGLLVAGQDARAQVAFGELASANPREPRYKVGFGLTSALLGKHDLAVVAFDRALAIDSNILKSLSKDAGVKAAAQDLLVAIGPNDHAKLHEYLKQLAASDEASHAYP